MTDTVKVQVLRAEIKRLRTINRRLVGEINEADRIAKDAVRSLESAMQLLAKKRGSNVLPN